MVAESVGSGMVRRGEVVITGGAGFIGTNLAHALASRGERVVVLDALGRPEAERNAEWLRMKHGARMRVVAGDVRDAAVMRSAVCEARTVFHLAAAESPATGADADANECGMSNVLDAVSARAAPPALLVASTTRVYGPLEHIPMQRLGTRYLPIDGRLREGGIDENQLPDGDGRHASWVAIERAALERARSSGLAVTVFRVGSTYGMRQPMDGDQGWVPSLMRRILARRPLLLHGDGRQVRDLLFVADLVDAMELWQRHSGECAGRLFNVGGGPKNAVSLIELVEILSHMFGITARATFQGWTADEPRFWITNTDSFASLTGWRPRTPVQIGLRHLHQWIREAARAEWSTWAESAVAG